MVKSLAAKALKGDIKMAGAILDLYVPFAPKQPPGDIEISIENGLRLDD
jgi:hypothetical protein